MNAVSPLPAMLALITAIIASYIITKLFGAPPKLGRFSSIDGLRGYLAFFVYLHHASIWYFYLQTGSWQDPPSNLYVNFGQSSVALFFMITGFLFFSKLIDGKKKGINWEHLYISRILRLTPLYIFAIVVLVSIVMFLSQGEINVPILDLAKGVVNWLSFTILGTPNLNGIENTSIIIAKVTWSLPYEWFFYLLLPLLGLAIGIKPKIPYFLLGIFGLFLIIKWNPQPQYLVAFLGGIISSFLVRIDSIRNIATHKTFSLIIFICIGITAGLFPSIRGVVPLLLLLIAFALIACGNTLFGILVNPISRTLGEISYSIYLLHGIILFITINFIIGVPETRALSPFSYWLVMIGASPILIFICFVTFTYIEKPAMKLTPNLVNWLTLRRK